MLLGLTTIQDYCAAGTDGDSRVNVLLGLITIQDACAAGTDGDPGLMCCRD